jgi:hypothetical protein
MLLVSGWRVADGLCRHHASTVKRHDSKNPSVVRADPFVLEQTNRTHTDSIGMEQSLVGLVGRNQLFRLEPGMLRGPYLALAIEPVAHIHARGGAIAHRHPGAPGFQLDDVSGLESIGHF